MPCKHIGRVEPVPASGEKCVDCLKAGSRWVQLRICLTCGYVGCCDSSPGKHATAHFNATRHPLMASFEPGARWVWCYIDEEQLEVPEKIVPFLR
jgi:uncharacterized UBP type Zn finger protein